MRIERVAVLAAAMLATPALAEEAGGSSLCAERPGLTTDACIVDAGRIQLETSLTDWTLERDAGSRTDTFLIGDSLVRAGVGGGWELRLGWTPLGIVRERDGGTVTHTSRVGDISVGVKKALLAPADPDGPGLSLSIVGSATIPVGREPVGNGDWSATAVLPIAYVLSDKWALQVTPVVSAAVDGDGDGRHLAYGSAFGIGYAISDAISAQLSGQVVRDDDHDDRTTPALGSVSFAWTPNHNLQLDIGTNFGLNHAAQDVELYAGISKRF